MTRRPQRPPPHTTTNTAHTGDSKNTADKLAGDVGKIGQNVKDSAEHQTNKIDTDAAGAKANEAGDKAQSIGQNITDTGKHYSDKTGATGVAENVQGTAQHYMDKASESGPAGEKSYLEQAQDMAAGALNTASKAATGVYIPGRELSTVC